MTTYIADTAAKLVGYCNGTGGFPRAGLDDVIEVPAGTYNILADLDPVPGVEIAGVGPTTIIDGNRIWVRNLAGDVDVNHQLHIHDLVVDDLFRLFDVPNGLIENVEVRNVASNAFDSDAANMPCGLVCRNLVVHDAGNDCISMASSGGFGLASLLTLIDCEGYNGGLGAVDQVLTTHNSFPVIVRGGSYHDARGGSGVVVPAGVESIKCYGVHLYNPAPGQNVATVQYAVKCTVVTNELDKYALSLGGPVSARRVVGCRVVGKIGAGICTSFELRGNHITGLGDALLPVYFMTLNGVADLLRVQSNVIGHSATNDGRWLGYLRNNETVHINNNVWEDCGRAIYWRTGTTNGYLANNIFTAGTGNRHLEFELPVPANMYGGHNLFTNATADPFGAYVPQSGDQFNVTHIDLDELYIPRPGGNCDVGEGLVGVRGLGEPDLWDRPKLRADADTIGPVYSQRQSIENTMLPLVQFPSEMIQRDLAA